MSQLSRYALLAAAWVCLGQATVPAQAASTTTALTATPNPSTFGQSVTFTATVTAFGGGAPTGTVTFKDGPTTFGTDAVNVLGVGHPIATGLEQTCALTIFGGVKCWGYNRDGELGDGTTTDRHTPVDVSGLTSGVSAIDTSLSDTCALTSAGGVKCWGDNSYGQLGDGTQTPRYTPVDVSGLGSGASAIAVGWNHACALTSAGGVKCWGINNFGQLGDGTTTEHHTPVDVIGLTSGVSAITGNGLHTCALTSAGGVKCWGLNSYGRLGDGTTTSRTVPVDVIGLTSGVSAITAGGAQTCALTSAGGVKCWGINNFGQLGDGTTTEHHTPVDVIGLGSKVSAIATNGAQTCALTDAGGVKCWGFNLYGQLGDGTWTDSYIPVDVSGLASGVSTIALGNDHTCALTSTGAVKCWGYNGYGQLGDGNTTFRNTTPVDVIGLGSGTALVFGKATYPTATLPVGSHTITATYSGDVSHAGSTAPAVTQIVGPSAWSISPNSPSINENAGRLKFTITRVDSGSEQTVYVSTMQTEGFGNNNNYVGIADKALNFAIGQTTQAVTVAIKDNGIKEPAKTFAFIVQQTLGDPLSTYLSKATFTINDVDALGWSISPATQSINDSAGSAAFTLTRASGAGAQSVYVSTAQSEGSSNSHDYQPLVDKLVTFADGQTSQPLTVTIYNNGVQGPDKTFALIAQQKTSDPPTTYLAKATFTIVNTSNNAWWISPTVGSVHEKAKSLQFTVSRSNGSAPQTVYVSTTVTEGFANNNNYTPLTLSALAFAAGQTYQPVTITIKDNKSIEPDKTFGLIVQQNLGDPQTTYLAKATFTVINDDSAPVPKMQIISPYLMPAFKTTPTNLKMAAFIANKTAQAIAQAAGIAADDAAEAIVIYQTNGSAPVLIQATGAIVTPYTDNFLKHPPANGSDSLQIPSTNFIAVNGMSYAVALVRPIKFLSSPLNVRALQGTDPEKSIGLPIVPVPVILVHGLWGDMHSLDNLFLYLKHTDPWQQDLRNLVLPIQYPNYLAFDDDSTAGPWRTLDSVTSSAINFLDLDGARIVGARVDVIVHSMGGLVARVYSSKAASYRTWRDRRLGRIHQIITMDTPEIGSPIAQYLLDHAFDSYNYPAVVDYMPELVWAGLCGPKYLIGETLQECFEKSGKPMGPSGDPLHGAIASLAPGSTSLTNIQSISPKIAGAKWQAIRAQVPGVNNFGNQLVFVINNLIKGAGYSDSINSIFTSGAKVQPNDGVVSIVSQSALFKPDHTATFSNMAHAGLALPTLQAMGIPDQNVTASDAVNSLVVCWLLTNGDDSCKLSFVAQQTVPKSVAQTRQLRPTASKRLVIDQPKKVTLASAFKLTARVGAFGIERVVVQQRDELGHVGKAKAVSTQRPTGGVIRADVQPEFLGNVTCIVTTIYTDGAVSTQEITFPVGIPATAPIKFSGDANFYEILLSQIGASYQLHPQVLYANTPSAIALEGRVQYRLLPSTGESIVELAADGMIVALRAGTAKIEVRFGSSLDVINVIVRPGA